MNTAGVNRFGPATWAAVAVGGLAGTEARYGLLLAFPPGSLTFDWTTLGINAAASLLLGFLTARWLFTPSVPLWVRAGLGPGFLGSFSTFSALALHLDQLLAAGLPMTFALYLLLSMVLGLLAAAAGLAMGRLSGRRSQTRLEQA
ncbi:CrcB family protein [Arthrobacter sp. zg-Y877]|uniref:fluoride efflux transporter FluC n=1 Tax=Arthrobacter sp. zg-Y877 TaxID=3049074 RepID=UPI0025A32CD9|nr:CrcB family protein [Arthrobacter sp. zg-Y877]MDM7989775.1 CrcB family protein [Arthrobacter sp. zg-Y877]